MIEGEIRSRQAMSAQFVMTYSAKRPKSSLPYAFTEQGGYAQWRFTVGESYQNEHAIMQAFVAVRKALLQHTAWAAQVREIRER
jgi:hypothetical protein